MMTPNNIERKDVEKFYWASKPIIKQSLDYVYTEVEIVDWNTFNDRLAAFANNVQDENDFGSICCMGYYIGAEIESML